MGIINKKQQRQIDAGYEDGLAEHQIKKYAKAEFTWQQMEVLRTAIKEGISDDELDILLNPEFVPFQMAVISQGFEEGLNIDQVKSFAKVENDWPVMVRLKFDIKKEIDNMIRRIIMTPQQEEEISLGKMNGLTDDKINVYSDPQITWQEMEILRKGFEEGLSIDQVKLIKDKKYDLHQKAVIKNILVNGVDDNQLPYVLNEKIEFLGIHEIGVGIEDGFTKSQLSMFAAPKYTFE
jgi:hypothetical protein